MGFISELQNESGLSKKELYYAVSILDGFDSYIFILVSEVTKNTSGVLGTIGGDNNSKQNGTCKQLMGQSIELLNKFLVWKLKWIG